LVEAVFTDEDKKNLRVIVEEMPKLRLAIEELKETEKILSDEKLMKSIQASQKDIDESRTLTYEEVLEELSINKEEI
jgi:hypothetical protein